MAEDGTNGMDTSNPQQNDDDRKLFAGGLAQEATEKDITEYFSKFGEVIIVFFVKSISIFHSGPENLKKSRQKNS